MEISNGLKYGTMAALGTGAVAALVGGTNSLSSKQQNDIADTIGTLGLLAGAAGGGKMLYNHLHVKESAQEVAPHDGNHGTGGDGAVTPEDHAANPADVHTHLEDVAQEQPPVAPHDARPGTGEDVVTPVDHATTRALGEHPQPPTHDGNHGTGGDGVQPPVTGDSHGTNGTETRAEAHPQETSATQPNTTTWGDRAREAIGYDPTRSWGEYLRQNIW